MNVTVTMNREYAGILMRACEFYSRVMCGQYDEISFDVADLQLLKIYEEQGKVALHEAFHGIIDRRNKAEDVLREARAMQFPELYPNAHYGLGYTKTTDMAFSIYACVRHALAWHEHPEGGITVNFNKPRDMGYGLPKVMIEEEETK